MESEDMTLPTLIPAVSPDPQLLQSTSHSHVNFLIIRFTNLLSPPHLRLGLSSCHFPNGFPNELVFTFHVSLFELHGQSIVTYLLQPFQQYPENCVIHEVPRRAIFFIPHVITTGSFANVTSYRLKKLITHLNVTMILVVSKYAAQVGLCGFFDLFNSKISPLITPPSQSILPSFSIP
jgi:hypothetical protein